LSNFFIQSFSRSFPQAIFSSKILKGELCPNTQVGEEYLPTECPDKISLLFLKIKKRKIFILRFF